jgi:hypothetical protein
VDKTTGVRSDHAVILIATGSLTAYPEALRRVSGIVLQMNQTASPNRSILRNQQERREEAELDCRVGLCAS